MSKNRIRRYFGFALKPTHDAPTPTDCPIFAGLADEHPLPKWDDALAGAA